MGTYNSKKYSYGLAVPGLVLFTLFFILPTLGGVLLSFFKIYGFDFSTLRFAGVSNYYDVFTQPTMRKAISNSFIFAVVTTVLKMVNGMLLALAVNKKLFFTNGLRTIFFLPTVINTVAVGMIFSSMMHPTNGLINTTLNAIGLSSWTQNWLTDQRLAILSICLIEVWKWSGYTMVILLSGMQTISKDFFEAADLDGANGWQRFRYIIIPLLLPSINNSLILNIIGGLKVFDLVQATTQGGPGSATEVFGTLIYKSFGSSRFGEGCAASVLLALIIGAIVIPVYKSIANREVEL